MDAERVFRLRWDQTQGCGDALPRCALGRVLFSKHDRTHRVYVTAISCSYSRTDTERKPLSCLLCVNTKIPAHCRKKGPDSEPSVLSLLPYALNKQRQHIVWLLTARQRDEFRSSDVRLSQRQHLRDISFRRFEKAPLNFVLSSQEAALWHLVVSAKTVRSEAASNRWRAEELISVTVA